MNKYTVIGLNNESYEIHEDGERLCHFNNKGEKGQANALRIAKLLNEATKDPNEESSVCNNSDLLGGDLAEGVYNQMREAPKVVRSLRENGDFFYDNVPPQGSNEFEDLMRERKAK